MGQTPNVVETYDEMHDDPRFSRSQTGMTGMTGTTDTTGTTSDDPTVIEAEIEATRADMSQTINEIQERLNPETLKAHAKEVVHDATVGRAQEAVSNVSDRAHDMVGNNTLVHTIRQNPIPAALAGLGIGWLWMNRSKPWNTEPYYYQPGRHTTQREARYYSPGFQRYQQREAYYMGQQGQWQDQGQSQGGGRFSGVADTAGSAFGSVQHGAGSAVGAVTDTASSALGTVQGAAGSAVGTVQETAGQFAGQVGQWGSQAQGQVQDLRYRTDRMMHENPLPLGLVALGLGMAVGMLLPETEKERELMGEQRDQLLEKAQTAGQQVVEKVQQVAQDVTSTVQESAQQQGLSAQ